MRPPSSAGSSDHGDGQSIYDAIRSRKERRHDEMGVSKSFANRSVIVSGANIFVEQAMILQPLNRNPTRNPINQLEFYNPDKSIGILI